MRARLAAEKAGSSEAGSPALRQSALSPAPRLSRSKAATRSSGKPDSETKAASAKAGSPLSRERRISPEVSRPVTLSTSTMAGASLASPPAASATATRSVDSRASRALRSGVSQPQPVMKLANVSETLAAIVCRRPPGRSTRSSSASRSAPLSPWRSIIRSSEKSGISAVRLPASVTSASSQPTSANAAQTLTGRQRRMAMAFWASMSPTAAASTRSASVNTGECARTSAATSLCSAIRQSARLRGVRIEGAISSAIARRTSGEGSSISAISAVSASWRSSSDMPERR